MQLPFSTEQFLGVFREYSDAVGVAPALLMVLALFAIAMTMTRWRFRHRIIAGILAFFWLWSGVGYHWAFFSRINPLAWVFGTLFVVQGLLLAFMGAWRDGLTFRPSRSAAGVLGWVGVAYALLIYPILGWTFGHGYPAGPSFGAPCPVTIFFLGVMFWTHPPASWVLLVVPLAWAVLGLSAATQLGIIEDLAMPLLAFVYLSFRVGRHYLLRAPGALVH